MEVGSHSTVVLSLRVPEKERPLPNSKVPASASSAEARLVEGCRHRRIAAYEELYAMHGARMKSIALNLLGNSQDAEDAVQETFLKIYRGVQSFRGDSAFTTWIYRILVNSCRDFRRGRCRRSREVSAMEADPEAGDGQPQSRPDHPLRLTLERSLNQLSEQKRTVFLLFEVEGFRHQEISRILDIPEGTSKALLFQAKKQLQQMLWGFGMGERR